LSSFSSTILIIQLIFVLAFGNIGLLAQNSGCVNFNGLSQRITSESVALSTVGSGDFTFEAWIDGEITPDSEHPTIFSNRISETEGTSFFFFNPGGAQIKSLCVQLYGVDYTLPNNGSFNAEVLDGSCHHVAITRLGPLLTFYIDGISCGTTIIIGNPSASAFHDLWIGQDPIINSTLKGTISVLKIWSIALSEADLNSSKECSFDSTVGLEAYWKLDEGSGPNVLEEVYGSISHFGSYEIQDSYDPIWGPQCCSCDGESYTPPDGVQFEIPNVVTSNGDDNNDLFTPVSIKGIESLHCVILNRWGNIMYETFEINFGWDPKNVNNGVYYYKIDYIDNNDKAGTASGFFHVFK